MYRSAVIAGLAMPHLRLVPVREPATARDALRLEPPPARQARREEPVARRPSTAAGSRSFREAATAPQRCCFSGTAARPPGRQSPAPINGDEREKFHAGSTRDVEPTSESKPMPIMVGANGNGACFTLSSPARRCRYLSGMGSLRETCLAQALDVPPQTGSTSGTPRNSRSLTHQSASRSG